MFNIEPKISYRLAEIESLPRWANGKNADIFATDSIIDITIFVRVIIDGIPASNFTLKEDEAEGILTGDFLAQFPENSRGHHPEPLPKQYDNKLIDRISLILNREKNFIQGIAQWNIPLELAAKESGIPLFTTTIRQEYHLQNDCLSVLKGGFLLFTADLKKYRLKS